LVRRTTKAHWKRIVTAALPLVFVAAPVLVGYAAAAGTPRQPAVAGPGEPAPAIEATYSAAQSDPRLTDEERVRVAVDTYFTLQYESMVRQRALDPGFVIDHSTPAGQDLYNYELGRLRYSIACWKYTDTVLERYSYRPAYESVTVTGDTATVRVRSRADAVWVGTPDRVDKIGGVLHVIDLVETAGGWKLIRDSYDDEFRSIHPYGTNWAELEDTLPERLAAYYAREAGTDRPPAPVDPGEYRTYDRSRCAEYATTCANDDEDCSTVSYNPLFKDRAATCADGQNFVSQCVWYGFGGLDTPSAVENHELPMIDGISGAVDWWCDEDRTCGAATGNYTWADCADFENMIEDNYDEDNVGVQGHDGVLSLTAVGDIVRVPGHVFIINDIVDKDADGYTDYNEIYVCAPTKNRRNKPLFKVVSDPTDVRYVWIVRFKYPE